MDLRPEPILATTPELRQQFELQVLQSIDSKLNTLTVKLFGDTTVESQKGRLPGLERAVEQLVERVDKLEKAMIKYVGLASGAGFVIGVLLHFLWK